MKKIAGLAVLIPSYAPGDYILNCLDSLENQTLDKNIFCVYIALNGSERPYREFLLEALNGYSFNSRLFYLEEAGVSNARNFLLSISSEKYICFLDDDDSLSPAYLESLYNNSDEHCMAVANVRTRKPGHERFNDNYITRAFKKMNDYETSLFNVRQYFSSPCAKILHRDMIGDTVFDRSLTRGEDALFMTQLSRRIKSVKKVTTEAYYVVNKREGSATRSRIRKLEELKRVTYLVTKYLKLAFDKRYERKLVFSRILAVVFHLKIFFRFRVK